MTDEKPLEIAQLYAPIIERVHGENHPELTRVRELTEQITADGADLKAVFAELRTVTNDYAIPGDVCETFVATYKALEDVEAELVG